MRTGILRFMIWERFDCFVAAKIIFDKRSTFQFARILMCSFAQRIGTNSFTPNSTAFSNTHSKRSFRRKGETISRIWYGCSPHSFSSFSNASFYLPLDAISVITPTYLTPFPSIQCRRSPI